MAAKYNITQDDGNGGEKKTFTSKDGKYRVTTNNPAGVTSAGGVMVVGNGSKITINHAHGKTEVYKDGKRVQ